MQWITPDTQHFCIFLIVSWERISRKGFAMSNGKYIHHCADAAKLPSTEIITLYIPIAIYVCLFSPKPSQPDILSSRCLLILWWEISPHPYRNAEKHNIYLYTFYLVCVYTHKDTHINIQIHTIIYTWFFSLSHLKS